MKKTRKMQFSAWELSLGVGLVCMLLACIAQPCIVHWWGVAFEPLTDGILRADCDCEAIVLRSRLVELLSAVFQRGV